MSTVQLTGQLTCKTADEAATVARYLPHHIDLTRAEAGCLAFDVVPTTDPMVWNVAELFESAEAFKRHQERVTDSEWGLETKRIERNYSVQGLPD